MNGSHVLTSSIEQDVQCSQRWMFIEGYYLLVFPFARVSTVTLFKCAFNGIDGFVWNIYLIRNDIIAGNSNPFSSFRFSPNVTNRFDYRAIYWELSNVKEQEKGTRNTNDNNKINVKCENKHTDSKRCLRVYHFWG